MKTEPKRFYQRAAGMLRHAQPTSPSAHKGRTLITLLIMLLTTATAGAWDGSGTAESPYQIKSTADLDQLASDVNSGTKHEGDYFVLTTDITYTQTLEFGGVHLILADGKTMNVGSEDDRVDGNGIMVKGALNIYGQTNGTGALSVYATGNAIRTAFLYIYGGNVTANTDGNNCYALLSGNGSLPINRATVNATATGTGAYGIYGRVVNINGSNVTATGTAAGICADNGDITLDWNKPTDRIYANSYTASGTVQVASGKMFHNGTDFLEGTLLGGTLTAADVDGKTLRPALNATYTTANGTTATADAILLDDSDNSLPEGNYLATGTLNYTSGITLTGNVTLILADNCHMNVGTSGGENQRPRH